MKIALECKPDERLVMGIGIPRKSIVHQNDKGDVCNFLTKHKGNIGLIDEDPDSPQPGNIRSAKTISHLHGIKELQDEGNNRIVVLCPKLEDWILNACKISGIDPLKCHLPSKANELHKEINGKLDRFDKIVHQLLEAQNPGILRLKALLN